MFLSFLKFLKSGYDLVGGGCLPLRILSYVAMAMLHMLLIGLIISPVLCLVLIPIRCCRSTKSIEVQEEAANDAHVVSFSSEDEDLQFNVEL